MAFLYMFACNAVANRLSFLCCVCLSSSSVFYTQCCQFLWIVHSRLSLRYSLSFICPLSCIPNVTSFSRLSILHCPSVLFVFVLCLVYPMLPVSLDCPFFIAPQFCLSSSRCSGQEMLAVLVVYNNVFWYVGSTYIVD